MRMKVAARRRGIAFTHVEISLKTHLATVSTPVQPACCRTGTKATHHRKKPPNLRGNTVRRHA